MNYLKSQFSHPRGPIGVFVGMVLSRYGERVAWAIQNLDLQPEDHLLEVGFGPGLAIQAATRQITSGHVAGIELSKLMLQQASQRNRAAIAAGRVELRQGSATALPFTANRFDKVLTINSYHLWLDGDAGLREIHRVLKPGGKIAVMEQPPPPNQATEKSQIQSRGEAIMQALFEVEFKQIFANYMDFERGWATCVIGSR